MTEVAVTAAGNAAAGATLVRLDTLQVAISTGRPITVEPLAALFSAGHTPWTTSEGSTQRPDLLTQPWMQSIQRGFAMNRAQSFTAARRPL